MNNELLNSLIHESSFLSPYIKQFKKVIKTNDIYLLENLESSLKSIIDSYELVINELSYSGIIVYELNDETISSIINDLYKNLSDDGYLFIINSNKNFPKEIIDYLLKNTYTYQEEMIGDDKWNFLLYKKNTIK